MRNDYFDMKVDVTDKRDFDVNPINEDEAIALFLQEDFNLALARGDVIERAAAKLEKLGMPFAGDIFSRWDDYQEELRYLASEFQY